MNEVTECWWSKFLFWRGVELSFVVVLSKVVHVFGWQYWVLSDYNTQSIQHKKRMKFLKFRERWLQVNITHLEFIDAYWSFQFTKNKICHLSCQIRSRFTQKCILYSQHLKIETNLCSLFNRKKEDEKKNRKTNTKTKHHQVIQFYLFVSPEKVSKGKVDNWIPFCDSIGLCWSTPHCIYLFNLMLTK